MRTMRCSKGSVAPRNRNNRWQADLSGITLTRNYSTWFDTMARGCRGAARSWQLLSHFPVAVIWIGIILFTWKLPFLFRRVVADAKFLNIQMLRVFLLQTPIGNYHSAAVGNTYFSQRPVCATKNEESKNVLILLLQQFIAFPSMLNAHVNLAPANPTFWTISVSKLCMRSSDLP